jgi:hypothetical protein
MNKEFIPYEQALALKKLGFDEPCFGAFIGKEFKFFDFSNDLNGYVNDKNLIIGAPLYQQAFRWFREKYDLFGVVEGKGYDYKRYYVYSINGKWHPSQPVLDTYEEAELACLIKLIEIVKNNE